MPIRRDAVEGSVTASAIATLHHRIASAETLPHLRQPGTVGRLIVLVGIDRILELLARQATRMNHVAVSRLEIDAVNEIAINRSAAGKIRRLTKESDLCAASLNRQGTAYAGAQTSRPGTGGQDQSLASKLS